MFDYVVLSLLIGLLIGLSTIYCYSGRLFIYNFPGPFSIPLLGSVPYLLYQKTHQSLRWYETETEKYGPIFRVEGLLGTKKALYISDPKAIGHFLVKNFKNYERYPPVKRFEKLFGKGIFNSRGEVWMNQRRIARPFFKVTKLEEHIPKILSYVDDLIGTIKNSHSPSIDLQEMFYELTLKIICDIGFGVRNIDRSRIVTFNNNFNKAQEIVERNIRNPILDLLPDSEFDTCIQEIENFIEYIIQESSGRDNLLHLFRNETISKDVGPDRDTILNFIIAGRDTTATLLSWSLFCISLHPNVEIKLREEIKNLDSQVFTQTEINRYRYLRSTLNEVLRLYPPIPADTRRSKSKDTMFVSSTHKYRIPAGTFLVYSAWIMGRNKRYWKDPLKFRPERWTPDFKPERYTFLPFHIGPQTCMGKNLAYLEASIILIKLLHNFTF